MTKILNKKERVYDLRLTGYAKHLMSVGKYKPAYYAFFDDNITYDIKYRRGGRDRESIASLAPEAQNSVNVRIKDETVYLGSLTLFEDTNAKQPELQNRDLDEASLRADPSSEWDARYERGETPVSRGDIQDAIFAAEALYGGDSDKVRRMFSQNFFAADISPEQYVPRQDVFKYDSAIGDALLDSKYTDVAPAWKIVVLNGKITSSEQKFRASANVSASIPQVNITVDYKKEIRNSEYPTRQSDQVPLGSIRGRYNRTPAFSDNNFIRLSSQDPIIYVDEVNTELLSENFDIEIFLVTGSTGTVLERKYFETKNPQVVDGMMIRSQPTQKGHYTHGADSTEGAVLDVPPAETAVEYYFDLLTDSAADSDIVCKQLQIYNKSSYYIDLDLDCTGNEIDDIYNDIYGSEVEPEICLD
jgi:hypothetical protein